MGNDLFGFKLNYDTPEISGSTSMFNGNISETIWKTKNDETSSTPWVQRAYSYQYDPLNRITKGDFKIKNSTGVFVSSNYTEYCLSNVTYDKNGNIRTLKRYTNSGYYPMDDLTYSYDIGNKLLKVVDNGHPTIKVNGFKDGTNTGNDYTYDGNGNLKEDKNKGISNIIYNHLNLPLQITFASGKIEYFYDAVGIKQKKIVTEATGTTTTIYSGNYIYQNNALQMINQPEGYLEPNGQGGYDYGYRLKVGAQRACIPLVRGKSRLCGNHLGNIRLTFVDFDHHGSIALSEITEENNYYPFGLKHIGYNDDYSSNRNAIASKFKYNGKELQDDLIGSNSLDWYDYGARFYDAALGRWHNVDPLLEFYKSWSPYNYAVNSPIRFLDPNGMSVADQFWNNIIEDSDVERSGSEDWEQEKKKKEERQAKGNNKKSMNAAEVVAQTSGYRNQYEKEPKTIDELVQRFDGMTYDEIMLGEQKFLGIKYPNRLADPKYGFVTDPTYSNYEIDMIHFLVVGKMGEGMGIANEFKQFWQGVFGDDNAWKSAFYMQDLYSNNLGVIFFNTYDAQLQQNPTYLVRYIQEFLLSGSRGYNLPAPPPGSIVK